MSAAAAALAADGLLPAVFNTTNARGVPVVSVVACSVLYSIGLLFSFRRLVEIDLLFYGAALALELVALVILRVKEPHLARPFRVPGGLPGAVVAGLLPMGLFAFALVRELGDGKGHRAAILASGCSIVVGAAIWLTRRRPSSVARGCRGTQVLFEPHVRSIASPTSRRYRRITSSG